MKAKDIMTSSPCCCSTTASVQEIAGLMRDNDCGSLPVVEDGRVVGIVTDRDLAIRVLAAGKDRDTRARDVMTPDPRCCDDDDDVRDVEKIMTDNQVRRVPVVDSAGRCIGIISQADLARAALDGDHVSEHEVAIVVEAISTPPRHPVARATRNGTVSANASSASSASGPDTELEQRL